MPGGPPRNAKRRIHNLRSAELSDHCPTPKKMALRQQARGSALAGLRYQHSTVDRKLVDLFRQSPEITLHPSQIILFTDESGPGWCELDNLILADRTVIVIEAKLTYTPTAFSQIAKLYEPLCEYLWPDRIVQRMQVCKDLTLGCEPRFATPVDILRKPTAHVNWTWHLRRR